MLRRQQLNRRGLRPMTATGGTRRLGVDREDAVPGLDQRREDRRSKSRRAHEDEVERSSRTVVFILRPSGSATAVSPGLAAVAGTRLRFALASLRRIIPRLTEERWSTKRIPSRCSISCCRQVARSPDASHLADLVLVVEVAKPDLGRPCHVGIMLRQRQAPLAAGRQLGRAPEDFGVGQLAAGAASRPRERRRGR